MSNAAPPPIDDLIIFAYSTDLERSHHFYGGVLGLDLTLDQGTCRIYRVTNHSYLGVCDHLLPQPDGTVITVVSGDVDGWYDHLTRAGVPTDGPPRHNERFGIYQFFASDPDGYAIEFQRFDADWPDTRPAR